MTAKWVLNTGLSHSESVEFFDLFVDDVYQHIWLRHDVGSDVWQFVSYSSPYYRSPFFKSMEEAKEHLTTFNVTNKLEGRAV
jgi:hypothetical protein